MAEEAGGGEAPAERVDPKVQRSRLAAAVVQAAVVGTQFAAVVWTRDIVVAVLWGLLGVAGAALAYYLFRGRFNAWGAAILLNSFAAFLGVVRAEFPVIVAVVASYVVFYLVRLPFGVGAWKIEADRRDVEARGLVQARTGNPQGLKCPKCGNATLWIAEDGSAFCLTCRVGTIDITGRQPS